MPTAMPAAILLAAGASSRMGEPKALLPWRGTTCLRYLVRTLAAFCEPVVLVVAADVQGERLLKEVEGLVRPLKNHQPAQGPISSLRIAAKALLQDGVTSAIICPVDQPAVTHRQLLLLRDALWQGARVVLLSHQGRDGHPYALGDLHEIVSLQQGQTARDLMSGEKLVRIEVGPEVLLNLNTPPEYAHAYSQYGLDGDSDGKDS